MSLKVAEIPYLNCAPFYWDRKLKGDAGLVLEWIALPPRQLGVLAKKSEVDVGPISLMDSLEIESTFEPLSDLGIAARSAARSVLLFSKKPIALLSGQRVGITDETATSSELLKVILKGRYSVEPQFSSGFAAADVARLLIGDPALAALKDPYYRSEYQHRYDLGEEWNDWQKLPFVFARWMVRKDLPESSKNKLSDFLKHNLEVAVKDPDMILKRFPVPGFMTNAECVNYLSAFTYYLGSAEKEAVRTFRRLSRELFAPAFIS